jgi:hypothetical protein
MSNHDKTSDTDRRIDSGWMAEKSSNAADHVSNALDIILQSQTLDGATKELVENLLSGALYDISKLMASSVGCNWTAADAHDMQDNGQEGFKRVASNYGISCTFNGMVGEVPPEIRLESFADSLSRLLAGPRSPNRTFVHELLNRTTLDHPIVEQTARLIELVTNGQMQWPEFCTILDSSIHALNLPKATNAD